MPNVTYRLTGELITAEQMNELFAELDRKAALALDDHSILYLIGEDCATTLLALDPYLGPRFIWNNGTDNICGYFSLSSSGVVFDSGTYVPGTSAWSYNHSLFADAVVSAVPFTHVGFPVAIPEAKVLHIDPLGNEYWSQRGRFKNAFDPSVFDHSLEAHRKLYTNGDADPELYWIGETRQVAAALWVRQNYERIRNYAQAELMFEGVTALDFEHNWNKYNFFRIHNINTAPFTIRFKKKDGAFSTITKLDGTTAESLSVPAHSSKCIRRYLTSGSYTDNPVYAYVEGYKYFQKFRSGDPRFYQQGGHQAQGSNNIFNPSIVIPFVNRLLAGNYLPQNTRIAIPTVLLDPHVKAPLPLGYEDKFGVPTEDDTILGNLLHHKGKMLVQPNTNTGPSTSFTWPGYGAPTPSQMLSRTVGDEMEVKSATADTYLLAIGTNLLYAPANFITNALTLPDGYTRLPRAMPLSNFYKDFELIDATAHSVTFNAVNPDGSLGAATTVTSAPKQIAGSETHSLASIVAWRDTVEAVKNTLDVDSFTSTALVLTSSGLVLNTTQTIPLNAPLTYARNPDGSIVAVVDNYLFKNLSLPCIRILTPTLVEADSATLFGNPVLASITLEGTNLIIKRSVVFTNYGFPDTDNWLYTGFFSPRDTRIYTDRTDSRTVKTPHPDFSEGIQNQNGEEIVYKNDVGFIETDISILSPWNAANYLPTPSVPSNNFDSGRYQMIGLLADHYQENLDLYQRTRGSTSTGLFVRMGMIVEMFNNLAAKVNSMVRYQPLNFLDHAIFKTGLIQLVRQRFFRSNERGIWTHGGLQGIYSEDYALHQMQQYTGLRPSDQYCSFGPKQNEVVATNAFIDQVNAQCTALGIPIRTQDDFPQWEKLDTKQLGIGFTASPPASQIAVATDTIESTSVNPIVDPNYFWDVIYAHKLTFNGAPPVGLDVVLTETQTPCRSDLSALAGYKWVKISDIKTAAEARGYKFIHAQWGVRFDLEVVQAEYLTFSVLSPLQLLGPGDELVVGAEPNAIGISEGWLTNYQATPGVPGPPPPAELYPPFPTATALSIITATVAGGLSARFVEFLPATAGEWIAGCDQIGSAPRDRRIGVNVQPIETFDFGYSASVRFVFGLGAINWMGGYVGPAPSDFHSGGNDGLGSVRMSATARVTAGLTNDKFKKVSWAKDSAISVVAMRNPADYASTGIGSDPQETVLITEETPTPVVVKSASIPDNTQVMSSPTPSFDFDVSVSEADFVRYGVVILPCTINPTGAQRVQLLSNFMTAF